MLPLCYINILFIKWPSMVSYKFAFRFGFFFFLSSLSRDDILAMRDEHCGDKSKCKFYGENLYFYSY